jgi:hypothetical protein
MRIEILGFAEVPHKLYIWQNNTNFEKKVIIYVGLDYHTDLFK